MNGSQRAAARSGLLALLAVVAISSRLAGGPVTVPAEQEADVSGSPSVVSAQPRVAVGADGAVHVAWEEGLDIRYRSRSPRGEWADPVTLFYGGSQPAIATLGSAVAVALVKDASRDNPNDKTQIFVRTWDPVEKVWSDLGPPVDLSDDGAQPDLAYSPRDGSLWVAWSDYSFDGGRPYLARIVDGQVTSANKCGNFDAAMAPSIAIDAEGTVFVARTDMHEEGQAPQVSYARLAHGTATCTNDDGPPAYDSRVPSLAINDDRFCLAWQQQISPGNDEVVLGCREPGGWLAPNMSNTTSERSLLPRLVLDALMGSMVVWQEAGESRQQVMYRQNLPPPVNGQPVTSADVEADSPDLAYSQGVVHSVWVNWHSANGADVRYAQWQVTAPTPTPTATEQVGTATATATATASSTGASPRYRVFVPMVVTQRR